MASTQEPTTPDQSLDAFRELRDELSALCGSDLNEADTRAKIIDRLFKDVFGWSETGIKREQRTLVGDYLDYEFESPTNRFVVEAKRAGVYFEVPSELPLRLRREGSVKKCPSLYEALHQVAGYCTSEGFAVGVANNGSQLAITLTYSPGDRRSPDTLVFTDFFTFEDNFPLLWAILSPYGNARGRLEAFLRVPAGVRPAPTHSRRLAELAPLPDQQMDRNPIDMALAPLIKRYFSDLVGEDKAGVLKEAYVESGRQAQYGKQIDALLRDTAPTINLVVRDVETTRRSAPEMDDGLRDSVSHRTSATAGTVFLIVGGVGAGKTTFLHRYFRYLIAAPLMDAVLPVFLDFTQAPPDPGALPHFVDRSILDGLVDGYPDFGLADWSTLEKMYGAEIARLRRGELAPYFNNSPSRFQELVSDRLQEHMRDLESHAAHVLRYLDVHHNKSVCVVFDNVDQFGQDIQYDVLKLAFQKARVWKSLGILAVREEPYWRNRNQPPFDAYHRYAYHISAPNLANVLSLRLALVKKEAGSQSIALTTQSGINVSNISIASFVELLVESFLGNKQRNIKLLEAISGNDVRQGLDMFATFLTSGHTNTDEYIKAYTDTGSYRVPFHAVLRSIAYAERRYYDSSKSIISNIFSVENDVFYSHFQKFRVLRYLLSARSNDAVPGRGYVSVSDLASVFGAIAAGESGIRNVLDPLLRQRLVEAANGYRSGGEVADAVRITAGGVYYIEALPYEFSYLDLVADDTPIKDPAAFEQMRLAAFHHGGGLSRVIADRLQKVDRFLTYLQGEEDAEVPFISAAGLPEGVTAPIVEPIRAHFEEERADVARGAARKALA